MTWNFKTKWTAAAVGLALSPTATLATDLTYATGFPAGHPATVAAEAFAEYSESHGGPKIRVFPQTLLSFGEMSDGIRDGVADMGFNINAYFQAEFPNSNMAGDLGMLATSAVPADDIQWPSFAMAGAVTEYILLDCPECLAEFEDANQIFLSGQSSPPYVLQCTSPISTLEEVKGKQIRTVTGYWSRWAESVGATPVYMPVSDAFTALSQGAVDCIAVSPGDLLGSRLIDVIKSVTLGVPQGVFGGAAIANTNTQVWRSLSVDERKVLLEAAAYYNAAETYNYGMQAIEGLQAAEEQGLSIQVAGDDLMAATLAEIEKNSADVATTYGETHGVTDAEAKVAKMSALITKWLDLTKDIERSPEALHEVFMSEIYSKIDAETYGMN